MKTIAGRARDLDDVRSIVLKNPELNVGMVCTTLRQFDEVLAQSLLPRFEQAIR